MLRNLAIFSTVVTEKTFAAAARKLEISPSRVSEAVSGLESYINFRLINRSTRQLSLTNEGKSVFKHANKLPGLLEEAYDEINHANLSGKITLTCTHDLGVKILADCLASFERVCPDIRLELVLSDQPLDLISNEIDIAVRIGVPKDSSYIVRTLHTENLGVYASPEFLLHHGPINSLEELQVCNWVCLKQLMRGESIELTSNEARQVISIKNSHFCDSPIMVQKMLCSGMGVGILLPSTIKHELNSGQLIPVLPNWVGPSMEFALYYPSRRNLPNRTRCLVEYILSANLFESSAKVVQA